VTLDLPSGLLCPGFDNIINVLRRLTYDVAIFSSAPGLKRPDVMVTIRVLAENGGWMLVLHCEKFIFVFVTMAYLFEIHIVFRYFALKVNSR
jgi:hypothetical protein